MVCSGKGWPAFGWAVATRSTIASLGRLTTTERGFMEDVEACEPPEPNYREQYNEFIKWLLMAEKLEEFRGDVGRKNLLQEMRTQLGMVDPPVANLEAPVAQMVEEAIAETVQEMGLEEKP